MVSRDSKTNQNNIHICPRCKGNGYITIPNKSVEEIGNSITIGCTMCESEGEIDDPNDTIIIDADGTHRLQ
jgi:DnaJ-class molecular chaperone